MKKPTIFQKKVLLKKLEAQRAKHKPNSKMYKNLTSKLYHLRKWLKTNEPSSNVLTNEPQPVVIELNRPKFFLDHLMDELMLAVQNGNLELAKLILQTREAYLGIYK